MLSLLSELLTTNFPEPTLVEYPENHKLHNVISNAQTSLDIIENLSKIKAHHLIENIFSHLTIEDFKNFSQVSKLYLVLSENFLNKIGRFENNVRPVWFPRNDGENEANENENKNTNEISAYKYSKLNTKERLNSSLNFLSNTSINQKPNSLTFRQLCSDGTACWLDGSYLEDRFDQNLKIPIIHLNYVWWLDVKVGFRFRKCDVQTRLRSYLARSSNSSNCSSSSKISKIILKSRWFIRFNENFSRNRREDRFEKYTNHVSNDLKLEMSCKIQNFENPSKKSSSSIQASNLYGNYTIIPKNKNFQYNQFINFESKELNLILNLDELDDEDWIEIECRYFDGDCGEIKSDIDFGYVDLVMEEV